MGRNYDYQHHFIDEETKKVQTTRNGKVGGSNPGIWLYNGI